MGDEDSKSVYLKNTLTVLRQSWTWSVVDRGMSLGTSWPCERSRDMQSWSWKAAVHDQRSAGDTLRSEKFVKATGETVRVGHARLETVCTIHVETQRRVAVPDSARHDADWASDAKSIKSTSSVFTRIDGFIIGVNAQLQDTHAQSGGECDFYALGAGCADGLYVKSNPERSRRASQDQSTM